MQQHQELDDFQFHRVVFVFEYPQTKDWVGIVFKDFNLLPVYDNNILNFIKTYHGDLKCDFRYEYRDNKGIVHTVGFDWDRLRTWDRDLKYRYYYSGKEKLLLIDNHMWRLVKHNYPSVISILYMLASKRYFDRNYKTTIVTVYKTMKYLDSPTELSCYNLICPKTKQIILSVDSLLDIKYIEMLKLPCDLPPQILIIKPYKVFIRCNIMISDNDVRYCVLTDMCNNSVIIEYNHLPMFLYRYSQN
jgi:hypothetical protein